MQVFSLYDYYFHVPFSGHTVMCTCSLCRCNVFYLPFDRCNAHVFPLQVCYAHVPFAGNTVMCTCSVCRCKVYDPVPAGCTLVVDPQDPTCCKVPQCAPTPGPLGFPTPPPGQSPTPFTVTNVHGVVTGRAPTPTPGTNGQTPQPRSEYILIR